MITLKIRSNEMTREEVKEFLLSKCKILNTYSWSDDRKAYDVPKYVLSDSKTLKLIDQIYNYNEAQLKAKDKEIERLKAELAIATKRFDAKNREGKALKKTLSMAWSKQLKEQQ